MKLGNNDINARKGFGIVLQLLGIIGLFSSLVTEHNPAHDTTFLLYVFVGISFVLQAKDLKELIVLKTKLEKKMFSDN